MDAEPTSSLLPTATTTKLNLFDLPSELFQQIFHLLSPLDLLSCQLTNKYLYTVIQESVVLQYHIALSLAKAQDNPCSVAPLSEKLKHLKTSEEAWGTLDPQFTASIPVPHHPSGIYDLTGGTYLLGNFDRMKLHYIQLPTRRGEAQSWMTIGVDRMIIDMGLCVFEHDLIVIVTTHPAERQPGRPQTYDIEMVLLEYSTGKPHPQAKESRILVMNSEQEKPAVGIEIVGENLVLILTYLDRLLRADDRVFMYDWRANVLKTTFSAPHRSYSGLLFLSEHLVLLPNSLSNALDVYIIPSKPSIDPLTPILSLSLPALADGRNMGHISCRAEPNPIGDASRLDKRQRAEERAGTGMDETDPFQPRRGFLASADDAVCVFSMKVLGVPVVLLQAGLNLHLDLGNSFTFIIHRRAFLDLVKKHENTFDEQKVAAEEAPLSTPPTEAEPPSEVMPSLEPVAETPTAATPPPPATHGTTAPPPPPPFARIPWAQWGPPVSRWFKSDTMPTRWITTTAGQRCVVIAENARQQGSPYVVMDFNADNYRRIRTRVQEAKRKEEERRAERRRRKEEIKLQEEELTKVLEARMKEESDEVEWMPPPGYVRMPSKLREFVLPETEDEASASGSGSATVPPAPEPPSMASYFDLMQGIEEGEEVLNPHDAYIEAMAQETQPPMDVDENVPEVAGDEPQASGSGSAPTTSSVDQPTDDDDDDNHSDSASSAASMPVLNSVSNSSDDDDDQWIDVDDDESVESEDSEEDVNNPFVPRTYRRARIWITDGPEKLEASQTFAEVVESQLPYVSSASRQTYQFDGVLLDEERVLGITTDILDRIRQVDVHYFG